MIVNIKQRSVLYTGNYASVKAAVAAAASVHRLVGADLSGADLSGMDLTGANLSNADLSAATLTGTKLTGANLSGADLHDAVLDDDTDFQGANITNTYFGSFTPTAQDARFTGANVNEICPSDTPPDQAVVPAVFDSPFGPAQLVKFDGVATTADGRLSVRDTTANRTTNFKLRAITVHTADLTGGVHNVSPVSNQDYGDLTVHLYDANGNAITDEQNEGLAVKTVFDFDPTYNYEIIGGFMDLPSDLKDGTTNEWYISAVGVPDYPPQYYGQIDFISEVNLEAVSASRVTSDGRAVSYMPYNYGGNPYTNRLRFTIKHPVGIKKRFQIYIEHFV